MRGIPKTCRTLGAPSLLSGCSCSLDAKSLDLLQVTVTSRRRLHLFVNEPTGVDGAKNEERDCRERKIQGQQMNIEPLLTGQTLYRGNFNGFVEASSRGI